MSMADEFRQYAEEALRGAERSKTAEEKQALIGLARTWTEAAVQIGHEGDRIGAQDLPLAPLDRAPDVDSRHCRHIALLLRSSRL